MTDFTHDPLRDPMKRATNLGSAQHGVGHFLIQRLTALALIPLAIWAVVLVLGLLHGDYATARATVAQPLDCLLLILFVIAMFWHAQLGLQVIIEDYVHTYWLAMTLQVLVKFACFMAAVAGVLALLRIALGS